MIRFASAIVAAVVTLATPQVAAAQTVPAPSAPPPVVQTLPPPDDDGRPPQIEPEPFWTRRHIIIVTGYAAAVTLGLLTWSKDRELADRRRAIEALPPGATDEFTAEKADAEHLLGVRDLLGAGAISVAAGTSVYAISPRFTGAGSRLIGLPVVGGRVLRVSLTFNF